MVSLGEVRERNGVLLGGKKVQGCKCKGRGRDKEMTEG